VADPQLRPARQMLLQQPVYFAANSRSSQRQDLCPFYNILQERDGLGFWLLRR
jgi:hypothetical protein